MCFWPLRSRKVVTKRPHHKNLRPRLAPIEPLEERRLLSVSNPEVSVEISQNGAEEALVDTVIEFQRTGNTSESLTVHAFLRGTAVGGVDFESPAGIDQAGRFSVTFGSGESSTTLALPTLADSDHDPAETIMVVLDEGSNYSIQPGQDRALGLISEVNTTSTLHKGNRTSQSVSTHRNDYAFAALLDDGSVTVWGGTGDGGFIDDELTDLDGPQNNLTVKRIASNETAFAALLSDGSVTTWGNEYAGGDPTRQDFTALDFNGVLNNAHVVSLHSTNNAFSAILSDQSVVAWGGDIESGFNDGNIVPGGTKATSIASTFYAFAAIQPNGTVKSWGDPETGGSSTGVDWNGTSNNLTVVDVFATDYAFAALRSDGSVVTWGDNEPDAENLGGDSSGIDFDGPGNNRYVVDVTSTSVAFAALFNDGTVETWGDSFDGGDSSGVDFDGPNDDLYAVKVFSTDYAFSALLNDGSIVSWGDTDRGGDSSGIDFDGANNDLRVIDVVANDYAFTAIRDDGTVVSWGDTARGGDSSSVNFGGRKTTGISAADQAFAALLDDGDVVTWGKTGYGGDSSAIDFTGTGNDIRVTSVTANSFAFAAMRTDGSVVTWGHPGYGGDSSTTDFNGENGLAKVVGISSPFVTTTLNNPSSSSATTLENKGNTALNQRENGTLLANSAAVTLNGNPITTTLFDNWTVFEAEQINGVNKISAKNNLTGRTHRWSANSSWALNGFFSIENAHSITLPNRTSSGSDVVESEYTIDAAGSVTLSVLDDLRLLASGVELTTGSTVISQNSFADLTPIAAETIAGQNRLLVREAGELLREVFFDSSWEYLSEGNAFSVTGTTELNFQIDLDGDGGIGTLSGN